MFFILCKIYILQNNLPSKIARKSKPCWVPNLKLILQKLSHEKVLKRHRHLWNDHGLCVGTTPQMNVTFAVSLTAVDRPSESLIVVLEIRFSRNTSATFFWPTEETSITINRAANDDEIQRSLSSDHMHIIIILIRCSQIVNVNNNSIRVFSVC